MSSSYAPEPFDFGSLLVKNGFVPQVAVLECLEIQRNGEKAGQEQVPRLGELLVSKGYLTQQQVVDILSQQEKVILYCMRCEIQVNVQRRPDVTEFKCVRCESTLQEMALPRDVRVTDDSIIFISKEPVPREVEEAAKDPSRKFGKYTLINEIGRGAVGVVHRAWDHYLNQWVALKRIKPGTNSLTLGRAWHETRVISLLKEARSAVRLRHPNIVTIYDVGRVGKEFYISMEYLEGATLADHFRKARDGRKLSPFYDEPRKYIGVFRDIARALHYAHTRPSPVIHCDLKPSNIFVDRSGRGFVLDFGLAKDLRVAEEDPAGTIRGTPSYMAPEQASGHSEDIDSRTDVYGVGAMLYELISGRAPFTGDLVQVLRKVVAEHAIPPSQAALQEGGTPEILARQKTLLAGMEYICQKAMEKDKAQRYATSKELASALDAILKIDTRNTARLPVKKTEVRPPEPASPEPQASESQDLTFASGVLPVAPVPPRRASPVAVAILALFIGGLVGVGSVAVIGGRTRPVEKASTGIAGQVNDSVRRFRPDTAIQFCRAEQVRVKDPVVQRELEEALTDLAWVERLRQRVIESLNLARPSFTGFQLRSETLPQVEILKATRDGLVVMAGDQSQSIDWARLQPSQVTALVRASLGTLTVLDRFALALYAGRTDQPAVARELLESLSGTDLEIPAARELSRLPAVR